MLSNSCEVKGCEPDLVVVSGTLCSEEVLTAIEPSQRVIFAIVSREGQFVVARNGKGLVLFVGVAMVVVIRWWMVWDWWNWGLGRGKGDLCDGDGRD